MKPAAIVLGSLGAVGSALIGALVANHFAGVEDRDAQLRELRDGWVRFEGTVETIEHHSLVLREVTALISSIRTALLNRGIQVVQLNKHPLAPGSFVMSFTDPGAAFQGMLDMSQATGAVPLEAAADGGDGGSPEPPPLPDRGR